MDCYASKQSPAEVPCPACGSAGRPVPSITVKSLLKAPALERLAPGSYWICLEADCDVVYYGEGARFEREELRLPETPLVCYCFEIDEGAIDDAAESRIRDHVLSGRCACELRNPEGRCCLGRVRALVQRG